MIVKQQVLELVSFKLAPGSSEAEMLAASGICQSEFLQRQGAWRLAVVFALCNIAQQHQAAGFLPIFSWTRKMPSQRWNIAPCCGVPGMEPEFSVPGEERPWPPQH